MERFVVFFDTDLCLPLFLVECLFTFFGTGISLYSFALCLRWVDSSVILCICVWLCTTYFPCLRGVFFNICVLWRVCTRRVEIWWLRIHQTHEGISSKWSILLRSQLFDLERISQAYMCLAFVYILSYSQGSLHYPLFERVSHGPRSMDKCREDKHPLRIRTPNVNEVPMLHGAH